MKGFQKQHWRRRRGYHHGNLKAEFDQFIAERDGIFGGENDKGDNTSGAESQTS